jgi:hypothetical protein
MGAFFFYHTVCATHIKSRIDTGSTILSVLRTLKAALAPACRLLVHKAWQGDSLVESRLKIGS